MARLLVVGIVAFLVFVALRGLLAKKKPHCQAIFFNLCRHDFRTHTAFSWRDRTVAPALRRLRRGFPLSITDSSFNHARRSACIHVSIVEDGHGGQRRATTTDQ